MIFAAYLTAFYFLAFSFTINGEAFHFPPSNSNANATPIMRAWTCHGRNQREMVEKLAQAGIAQSKIVQDCLNKVDRVNYVRFKEEAYVDSPQSIGYSQTISAPHMHAHALEELLPALQNAAASSDVRQLLILDVGCGSGYLTASLARLANLLEAKPAKVYGIDFIPELVEMSKSNVMKQDSDLIESGTVEFHTGDGWKGFPSGGPYHAIHVGAAADGVPKVLMSQLAVGGRMIIPMGPDGGFQNLYKIDRVAKSSSPATSFTESDYTIKPLLGVRYVPLVHPP
jgi:protein-L-isoaspartate(D-aspartate) O-methyltransferase